MKMPLDLSLAQNIPIIADDAAAFGTFSLPPVTPAACATLIIVPRRLLASGALLANMGAQNRMTFNVPTTFA